MNSRIPASLRVIGHSIVDWWDGWLSIVMVILALFVCLFTVVLIGPAIFGLYYVVYNMINGEALGLGGMFEGAKRYFWKSQLWFVMNAVVILLAWFNIRFYGGIQAAWGVYVLLIVMMLTGLWFATQFYALPFFMEQDNKKLRMALRNGFYTAMAAPFYTMMLMLLSAVVLALSIGLFIPFFLGLPGLIPMLGFHAMYDRLESFGLREREKTPKEIEYEEGAKSVMSPFVRPETEQPKTRWGRRSDRNR